MLHWFMALSIRWKLQFGFFMVTMITTIFNRLLASNELGKMVHIAEKNGVAPEVIAQLEANHSTYIFNSFWESGLEFAIQFMVIGVVAGFFVRPIRALCVALQSVQQGDLTRGVPNTSQDEIGVLERSFNEVLKKLNHIMGNINDSGKEMEQSAYQIATISHEIAEVGKNEQQRSEEVTDATARLQEISESVQQLAHDATERAKQTEHHAQHGIETLQSNIRQMDQTAQEINRAAGEIGELSDSAEKIHDIVNAIKSIAEQTNLLSLNAAIEAARAGEAGRGFAVVADEVRNLSQSTSTSVGEISTIIEAVTSKIERVSHTMGEVVEQVHINQTLAAETSSSIEKMGGEVSESAAGSHKIVAASDHQLDQLGRLQQTLDKLFETLGDSSSKVENTAAIGDDLFAVTQRLNALMAGFTFNFDEPIAPASHEKRSFPRAHSSLLVKVDNDGHLLEGVSSDISLSGMQLRMPSAIRASENLSIQVYLPYHNMDEYEKQTPLTLTGNIIWNRMDNSRYVYGIEFKALNGGQEQGLRQCFEFYRKNPEFGVNARAA